MPSRKKIKLDIFHEKFRGINKMTGTPVLQFKSSHMNLQ